jgi:Tfp pilus assembly protein PilO
MKPMNREKLLWTLVIGLGGFAIVLNFILTPLGNWWSSRQGEIKILRAKIADGNALVKREPAIRGNWETKRANALPANTSLAEQQLLKSFTSWADDSGAQLTSIMPQWKNDSTNYMTLGCRVEAAGSMAALSKFVYDVERGPVALRLDTVELNSHDNLGQQLTLGLEVNGLALLQQPEKK